MNKISYFGDISEVDLAKVLTKFPRSYNLLKASLEFSGRKSLSNKAINLEETLIFLERANIVARNSNYFIFNIYDSWMEKDERNSEGIELYQQVKDEMIDVLSAGHGNLKQLEDVESFLRKKKVKKIFTGDLPKKGYCGLKPEQVDGEDVIELSSLEDIKLEGIKVVCLDL